MDIVFILFFILIAILYFLESRSHYTEELPECEKEQVPPEPMKAKGGRGGKGRPLRTATPKKPLTKEEKAAKRAEAFRKRTEYMAKKEAENRKKFPSLYAMEDARIAGVIAAEQQRRGAVRAHKQAESDRAAAASAAVEAERQKRQQDEARAAEMRAAAAKPRPRPKAAEYEPPTPAQDFTSGMLVGF